MQTVRSNLDLFSEIEVLELELEMESKRREDALRLAEHSPALPRGSAEYSSPAQITEADEDEWWSRRLGTAQPAPPPALLRRPQRAVAPAHHASSPWGWQWA